MPVPLPLVDEPVVDLRLVEAREFHQRALRILARVGPQQVGQPPLLQRFRRGGRQLSLLRLLQKLILEREDGGGVLALQRLAQVVFAGVGDLGLLRGFAPAPAHPRGRLVLVASTGVGIAFTFRVGFYFYRLFGSRRHGSGGFGGDVQRVQFFSSRRRRHASLRLSTRRVHLVETGAELLGVRRELVGNALHELVELGAVPTHARVQRGSHRPAGNLGGFSQQLSPASGERRLGRRVRAHPAAREVRVEELRVSRVRAHRRAHGAALVVDDGGVERPGGGRGCASSGTARMVDGFVNRPPRYPRRQPRALGGAVGTPRARRREAEGARGKR